MKKVFLSLPMSGRGAKEIRAQIADMKAKFLLHNPFDKGEEIEFVDNLGYEPDFKKGCKNVGLAFLSGAIDKLAYCDCIYFGYGWTNARGCQIEREVAYEYDIPCYIFNHQTQKFIDLEDLADI